MSTIGRTQTAADLVIKRFTKYLNGPLGKTVLENLEEGESFILQTSDHTMKVTKRQGKAIVEMLGIKLM